MEECKNGDAGFKRIQNNEIQHHLDGRAVSPPVKKNPKFKILKSKRIKYGPSRFLLSI
jgi:hypothetical protein